MATTMTLAQLRAAVRQRADMENSQFVQDSELNSYINQSAFELYDLLVQKYGDNYFVAPAFQIITDGTNDKYNLPADFYKELGVDLLLSNSAESAVTVPQFNFSDRNKYATPNFQTFYGVTNLRYRLNGNQIWFTPVPMAGQKINMWYVPTMTTMDSDSATLEGVSGWTEYVIIDAAIKCKVKEESEATILVDAKNKIINRIENAAENRNASSPPTVSDTMFRNVDWPNGDGGY
jgi:hypothetical protein